MDSKSSLGFKYDLDTEIGIKSILVAIRKSQLPIGERNELRDLVFLFINGGRDETVRNALMQKLAASGLEVKDLSKKKGLIPDNAPALSFGVYREAPTFSAPVVSEVAVSVATPAVVTETPTPTPIIPPAVTPAPVAVPPPIQPQPVATMVSPAPVATPAPFITQEPVAATPAPVVPLVVATPVPPVQTPVVPSPAPTPVSDFVTQPTITPPTSNPLVATPTTSVPAMTVSAPAVSQTPVAVATASTPTGVAVNNQPVPYIPEVKLEKKSEPASALLPKVEVEEVVVSPVAPVVPVVTMPIATPVSLPVTPAPIPESTLVVPSSELKTDNQPSVSTPITSVPTFEEVVVPELLIKTEILPVAPEVVDTPVAPAVAPLPVAQPAEPAPAIVTETVVAAPAVPPVAIPKVETPLPAVEKMFVPPTPSPVSTPTPAPVPTEVSKQTPPSSHATTNYLNRIRDIKASVNNKVGNPVNLIDINNEVGREYMNALLDAMKKVNGGLVGELDEAMARLEKAFVAVEKAVADNDAQAATPVATENNLVDTPSLTEENSPKNDTQTFVSVETVEKPSELVEKKEVQKKVESPVDLVAALSELPESDVVEAEEEENPAFTLPETDLSAAKLVTPAESGFADPEYKDGSFNQPVSRPAKESIRETVNALKLDQEVEETKTFANPFASILGDEAKEDSQSFTPKLDAAAPAENSFNTKLASIAEEKTPLTPQDLPETKDTDKAANPLFAAEVDAGLDQLLADWTLFKKSGLFGTGPKGREHPLFKKMAELQIPLILSGRFDGATQEIKQSVTDYMNGWRYEQGVVYEQGETFELYLRRVIRHILDLQK